MVTVNNPKRTILRRFIHPVDTPHLVNSSFNRIGVFSLRFLTTKLIALEAMNTSIANDPDNTAHTATALFMRCGKNQVLTDWLASGNNTKVSSAEGRYESAAKVAVMRKTTI